MDTPAARAAGDDPKTAANDRQRDPNYILSQQEFHETLARHTAVHAAAIESEGRLVNRSVNRAAGYVLDNFGWAFLFIGFYLLIAAWGIKKETLG